MYSDKPFQTRCARPSYPSFVVSYEWKSFVFSQRDVLHRQRVLEAARVRPFVLVIMGAGAHHFTKMPGHTYNHFHAVDDAAVFPQEWFNNYVNETLTLFELFSGLPDNVCVVWKGNNIGQRVFSKNKTIDRIHHPSAFNNIHHWLNRFTRPLADRYGISYVDVTDITSAGKPKGFGAPSQKAGLSSLEGDIYHGYSNHIIAYALLRRACEACPRQCGAPSTCELGLEALHDQRIRLKMLNATKKTSII